MSVPIDEPDILPSTTIQVHVPEGTMYVTIMKRNNLPYKIDVQIGKSGSGLRAWCDALARMVSMALRNGIDIHSIIEEISGITSDRVVRSTNGDIRSGPEGISYAMLLYLKDENKERRKNRRSRGPTIGGEEID